MTFPLVSTGVEGQCVPAPCSYPDAGGNVTSYDGDTLGSLDQSDSEIEGTLYVSNAVAPAYWDHEVYFPNWCAYPDPPVYLKGSTIFGGLNEFEEDGVYMDNKGTFTWNCYTPPSQTPNASSRFAMAGNIPASVTLSGLNPFSAQYGMPIMYMFNGSGGSAGLYGTAAASSVAPDGTSATFSLPGSLPSNAYAFETVNQNSDGTYTPNGFNFFAVASSQTIAGSPFGVAVGGQIITTINCAQQCSNTTTYATVPVISLYSSGQAWIGGHLVSVGANPTAVATYAGPGVVHQSFIPPANFTTTSFGGNTRAVVANSGSNTVSILDIVNNAVVATVTVGNQPDALAVSSDGSTAYVANYADSTVTQVNLTTNTPTTTVAVGGQPRSVALTSSGTLWVGGAGFLTEINTQNMSVVATESTAGETITALAYSDGQNELVATATSSGNLSMDELNPSAVQPGGTYTPLASHSVATLGTYYNPRLQSQVQGYTATVSTSMTPISTSLPGAPPLVVQDGWAVVTATPTGFTITDISGHDVLVSETTPSPVAAIAVDGKLNIAYLTMPDSDTVLTVPLPGTGN